MTGKKSAPAKPKSTNSSSSRTPSSRNPKSNLRQNATKTSENPVSGEELRGQQAILDIFSNTFREVLEKEDFSLQLQKLKTALFNRDFEGAFAHEAALDVYAARWSPTRALCYGKVLRGLNSHLESLMSDVAARQGGDEYKTGHAPTRGNQDESTIENETRNAESEASVAQQKNNEGEKIQYLKVLAIGGAAAEIVAFADYISSANANANAKSIRGEITLLDIGPWGTIVERLQAALTTTPPISRYVSAAAKEVNKALVPASSLSSTFLQKDILFLSQGDLTKLISNPDHSPVLISLLFTLNELYTTGGIKRTTSFLRLLSAIVPPGTLLLVVDSPGSYSETTVGKEAKRYPMQWLLDHTLLPPPSRPRQKPGGDQGREEDRREQKPNNDSVKWESIESHDSIWFRVVEGLRYPIPLENMRYQMHLYRASVD
ncbi:hypothetical protein NUW58_g35 [Xylaria curta]|uniref:Uncharacterized protein n=1 Tax=Xylaria curta TaxID=42375 RepID=A0ACC1PRU1_9PEZI|nr:hypothetical protein NUW58_g35 [Xylaria curta]